MFKKNNEIKQEIVKFKGKKFYGVTGENFNSVAYVSEDIEYSKRGFDRMTPILVEVTVTRVFTRERDLKEIELDI